MSDNKVRQPLTHEKYCEIIGQSYLDGYVRNEMRDKQYGAIIESLQTQIATLRSELEEMRRNKSSV